MVDVRVILRGICEFDIKLHRLQDYRNLVRKI